MEKLTSKLNDHIREAHDLANREDHSLFGPLHVLSAMCGDSGGILGSVASRAGLEPGELERALGEEIGKMPKVADHDGTVTPSQELVRLLNLASKQSAKDGDTHVSSDRFLQVCASSKGEAQQFLQKAGIDAAKVDEVVERIRAGEKVTGAEDEGKRGSLEKFTIDLTKLAREDRLDPVIGRDEEIRRAMQVLQRRTKNNPVLIGEPGVGKTAIVEGLAQRIAADEVPETLRNKTVLVLDIAGMLAGSKYRGEFEERLKAVLKAVSKDRDKYVLFIDELHTLVGAGASEGAVDAANMLKPALARGELRCIGATTLDEYRRHIERDAALERRFQRLVVQEPDEVAAVSILRGLADKYMLHHGVRITDPAIVAAVELSARYVTDRFLPDKAIDLIDEAAAKLRIERDSKPEEVDRLDRQIAQLKIDEASVADETDEVSKKRLKEIRERIRKTESDLADLTDVWRKEKAHGDAIRENKAEIERVTHDIERLTKEGKYAEAGKLKNERIVELEKIAAKLEAESEAQLLPLEVGEREVAEVVSRATGVPVSKMLGAERERLLGIADSLRSRVVNQDEAIDAVSAAVMRSRTGMGDPDRPSGCFMFLGPTGVGKTELAKSLAEFLFDSERHLVRIDMSEYMEKHAVARLIGAPPGYVGYDEGGQLTEVVRRKPYCVVLFDEIEKAHPEVFNVLLQTMDDGRLTDGQGRTVDFRNTVLIMTSNVGSSFIGDEVDDDAREKVMDAVRAQFRPEFLNRLDETVIFNSLDGSALSKVAALQLDRLVARLEREGIGLEYTPDATKLLSRIDGDIAYGARPVRRAMQAHIETPLSRMILEGTLGAGRKVLVDAEKGKFAFSVDGVPEGRALAQAGA